MDQNTIIEVSKLGQEVSKLGVEVVNKSSDLIKWIGGVVGIRDIKITYIKDKLEFSRWENQCKFANKFNEKNKNQLMQPLPPKFFIPILENGTLEEEENLQELWINLLGNWTKKENIEKRKMAYIDILKNLSMQDVKILDKVYKLSQKVNSTISYIGYEDGRETIKDYRSILINRSEVDDKLNDIIYYESVDNLIRLGCLRVADTVGKSPDILNITYLGAGLVEACIIG